MHRIAYSIISSASARSLSGTVNLSVLAVFILITSSNLTGVWTGSSLGFSQDTVSIGCRTPVLVYENRTVRDQTAEFSE